MQDHHLVAPPVALTIAGSDSSGAAGLQADLPTFAAFGVHGASVVTIVTAQDTTGILLTHPLPLDVVAAQLDAVLADLSPTATKTGLLARPAVVELVTARARAGLVPALVVDPVLVDSQDRPIGDQGQVSAYRSLLEQAAVTTPNRKELELLLGRDLPTSADVMAAAADIRALGAGWTVVTGGRDGSTTAIDMVIGPSEVAVVEEPRIQPPTARGSGCTLAAGIAAGLARGEPVVDAIDAARSYVRSQLELVDRWPVGQGRPGLPHVAASPAN